MITSGIRRLIQAYELHLQRMAEDAPPSQRVNAVYAAASPWVAPWVVAVASAQLLHLSRQWTTLLFIPAFVSLFGIAYTGSRIVTYGQRFDRTPRDAAWTQPAKAKFLIEALRRVTLNGLTDVTPRTRLREELRLTAADIAELMAILRNAGADVGSLSRRSTGLTVQMLLDTLPDEVTI